MRRALLILCFLLSINNIVLAQTGLNEARVRIRQAANNGETELDLSGLELDELPTTIGLATELRILNLSENNIFTIPVELTTLVHLEHLNVSGNRIRELPPEFSNLNNLDSLDLSANRISVIPPALFEMPQLEELVIDDNQLTSLPAELGQISGLQRLSLGRTDLFSLSSAIGDLNNLEILVLDENNLTALPPEIGQLESLKGLSVSYNQLNILAPEIGQLSNLEILWLSNNQLSSLPPEISQLTNLSHLDAGANQLTALPPEIGLLTNLTELEVYANQLTAFPVEIGQLMNLTTLSAYENRLTALVPEIGQLSSLENLVLYNNQIASLPSEIGQLSNLQCLRLIGNELQTFPRSIIQLENLVNCPTGFGLSFRGNPLSSIPAKAQAEGAESIQDYLRNPILWYLQNYWMVIAVIVGVLILLGGIAFAIIRWRGRIGEPAGEAQTTILNDEHEKQVRDAFAMMKRGDKKQAIAVVRKVLQEDKNNTNAWWLLSHLVDDEARVTKALEKVLEIQPGHNRARKKLIQLKPELAEKYPAPAAPVVKQSTRMSQGSTSNYWSKLNRPKKRSKPSFQDIMIWRWGIRLAIYGLIGIGLITGAFSYTDIFGGRNRNIPNYTALELSQLIEYEAGDADGNTPQDVIRGFLVAFLTYDYDEMRALSCPARHARIAEQEAANAGDDITLEWTADISDLKLERYQRYPPYAVEYTLDGTVQNFLDGIPYLEYEYTPDEFGEYVQIINGRWKVCAS